MLKKIISIFMLLSALVIFISCSSDTIDNELSAFNSEEKTDSNIKNEIESKDEVSSNILDNITLEAKKGKIINSNYVAGKDNISSTINTLGKEDSHNYVNDAKGTYYNYSGHNMVFGCNKGGVIFEVRSFDPQINVLYLADLEKYYGRPKYESKTVVGEKVIGYEVNSLYNILFVFKSDDNTNPKLDHYSILCPKETSNNMSEDPGRQW